MLNYLNLSHLPRLKNSAGSRSRYLMSFMSTDDRVFVTQENCRYVHLWGFDDYTVCLHSPAVHEICSPCQLLKRHIPGTSCELQSHQKIRCYTSLNQYQSATSYWCRRKAHSTSVPSTEQSITNKEHCTNFYIMKHITKNPISNATET